MNSKLKKAFLFLLKKYMRVFGRSVALCFHSVGKDGISKDNFCSIIDSLIELGYDFPAPNKVIDSKDKKDVYITFDDGYYDNLEITRDYLSHLNIKPIVFIVSELLNGNIQNEESFGLKKIKRFSFEDAEEYKGLIHFGYHTHNHSDLYEMELNDGNLAAFKKGHDEFLSLTTTSPYFFAYPFGYLPRDKEKFELILQDLNYECAFTTKWGGINKGNKFHINRVVIGDNDDEFKALLKISGLIDLYSKVKWRGEKYE